MSRFLAAAAALLFAFSAQAGPCLNKFLHRAAGPRQQITLLTGKLTFQEAQQLSAAIDADKAPALEWVDDSGKAIARQYGELKVVRPMPVGCDDKPSGVIMIATFATVQKPAKTLNIKLDANTTVRFEQQ
jgi:hypothetical protein